MDGFDVVLDGRSYLEGLRWHAGRVWAADCYAHEVVSACADGSDVRVESAVQGQPSGLGFLPDGRLVVASMLDRRILTVEPDGAQKTHADLSGTAVGEINDMAVDETGTCWIGCFGFDLVNGGPYAPAPLIRVDPDGDATVVADGLSFPNGVIRDGRVLVVAETFAGRMTAFDVRSDGALTGRRLWAEFGPEPEGDGFTRLNAVEVAPDGLADPDAEGAIWVADATHHRALRLAEGGEVLDEVTVGDMQVYATALGGPDGRTLFLAVAPNPIKAERVIMRESRLLARRVDVPTAGTR